MEFEDKQGRRYIGRELELSAQKTVKYNIISLLAIQGWSRGYKKHNNNNNIMEEFGSNQILGNPSSVPLGVDTVSTPRGNRIVRNRFYYQG